jgi:hypothetical protein
MWGETMLDWFKRRGQRPKRLAEMSPDELDAMLVGHPELEHLLRHALGVMQFAPPRIAEQVLVRVEGIVDETLRRNLDPEAEHTFVMQQLEELRTFVMTRE